MSVRTLFINAAAIAVAGSAAALPSTIDLLTDTPHIWAYGSETGASLGGGNSHHNVLLVADLDEDGHDDIVMAAWQADNGAQSSAGALYVWKGGVAVSSPWDAAGTLGRAPDFTIRGTSAAVTVLGDGARAADLNGDGHLDLVVRGYGGPGYVFIFFGPFALTGGTQDVTTTPANVTITGVGSLDHIGSIMLIGDITGDGLSDLAFGSSAADAPSRANAGVVYVVKGKTGSWPTNISLSSGAADVTIRGANTDDGMRVADMADFNRDGVMDLLLSAHSGDGAGEARVGCGEMYILNGRGSWPAIYDLASTPADVTVYGASSGDNLNFFYPPLTGDVNRDGIPDIVFTAQSADGPAEDRPFAGEGCVLLGKTIWPAAIDLSAAPADMIVYGAETNDNLGSGFQVGDWNGDGYDDVSWSSYRASGPGNSRPECGEMHIMFGGPSITGTTRDLLTQPADVMMYGGNAGDWAAINRSWIFRDIDGDGKNELILGVHEADGPADGRAGAGELYVLPGGAAYPASIDLGSIGSLGTVVYGAEVDDQIGFSIRGVGATDVNQDGVADLAIATSGGDGPGNARIGCGEVEIFLGDTSPASATVMRTAAATNPPALDFGTARTIIDYSSGTPGPVTMVTLHRNTTGIAQFPPAALANVHWEVSTERTGFSATVRFTYLDSEIAGMTESNLKLCKAPAVGGTYTQVATQSLDTLRNTITCTVTSFSDFVIVDTSLSSVSDWQMF